MNKFISFQNHCHPRNHLIQIILRIGFGLLIMTCFNAPSPSYMRPGHPAWPAGWVSGIIPDSIESVLPELQAQQITCVQCPLSLSRPDQKNLLSMCENRNIKLLLFFDPDEMNDLKTAGCDLYIRDRLQSWYRADRRGFPVDIIPGIRCQTGVSDSLLGIIYQAAESVVPGLLILYSVRPDSAERKRSGHSESSENLPNEPFLSRFSILVNYGEQAGNDDHLRIVVIDPVNDPAALESLKNRSSSLHVDAVMWENWNDFPSGFRSQTGRIQNMMIMR